MVQERTKTHSFFNKGVSSINMSQLIQLKPSLDNMRKPKALPPQFESQKKIDIPKIPKFSLLYNKQNDSTTVLTSKTSLHYQSIMTNRSNNNRFTSSRNSDQN